jgi:hypothetical protein
MSETMTFQNLGLDKKPRLENSKKKRETCFKTFEVLSNPAVKELSSTSTFLNNPERKESAICHFEIIIKAVKLKTKLLLRISFILFSKKQK